MTMIRNLLTAGVVAVVTAIPTMSYAWTEDFSPYALDVKIKIDTVLYSQSQDGLNLVTSSYGIMANDGEPGYIKVHLVRGLTYKFAARCDSDCHDIDMALLDADGDQLKADTDPDATPSFDYPIRWTGDYLIKLNLVDCEAYQCHVGAAVMSY